MYRRHMSISYCRKFMRCCVLWFYSPGQSIFYWTSIGWIIDWYDVCQIVRTELIQVGMIWIDVNRVRIFVIPNYRIFAPNFFNLKIIFTLSIFENVVVSKVFTFILFCSMLRSAPVGKDPTSLWQRVPIPQCFLVGFCHQYSVQHRYSSQFQYHYTDW